MQILNPAFVGSRADLSVSVLARSQWVGIEGTPTTQTFSINGRTAAGLGLGATAVKDKIGFLETTNVNLDVSYTIITSQYSRLSFGLKGGTTFFDNNLSRGITPDGDTYIDTTGQTINLGFGALYYNKKFFIGLSVPYLFKTEQFYTFETAERDNFSSNTNYFLSAGNLFELTETILFKPSMMVKYTANLPVSVDLNANFLYGKTIEAGISYRYSNSISALFTFILKEKFRIGYAYDHKFADYGVNLSSHEIILHIDLDLNRSNRWLLSNKCYF